MEDLIAEERLGDTSASERDIQLMPPPPAAPLHVTPLRGNKRKRAGLRPGRIARRGVYTPPSPRKKRKPGKKSRTLHPAPQPGITSASGLPASNLARNLDSIVVSFRDKFQHLGVSENDVADIINQTLAASQNTSGVSNAGSTRNVDTFRPVESQRFEHDDASIVTQESENLARLQRPIWSKPTDATTSVLRRKNPARTIVEDEQQDDLEEGECLRDLSLIHI